MDEAILLSREFSRPEGQVRTLIALLEEGCTVPFIARYRKEKTGAMDDQLIRRMALRLEDLRRVNKRREAILSALEEKGQLDEGLRSQLEGAMELSQLEEIYRPYKASRRTRAQMAQEKGLEPLSRLLMKQGREEPERLARPFVNPEKGIDTPQEALEGARDILAAQVAGDGRIRALVRSFAWREGKIRARQGKNEDEKQLYQGFIDKSEPVRTLADHRVLALARGEKGEYLKLDLLLEEDRILPGVCAAFVRGNGPCARQVGLACRESWKRLIQPSIERELWGQLTQRAQEGAVELFSRNLRSLLMQPPLRNQVVLGVDPGYRTGCKLAVVNRVGKVVYSGVGRFTLPGEGGPEEKARLLSIIDKYGVEAVAIGNGTASREAEAFIAGLVAGRPHTGYALVDESGASVYSASPLAAREFPQYDVTIRGAISIARRLQDPLSELVKIEPRSIGVGQYQHDVKPERLDQALGGVVEDCVSRVGVELSSASAPLLQRVAGVGPKLARAIEEYGQQQGFTRREDLKKVPGLGKKTFEQCAGFLRLAASPEPLDATAVHPESYSAARKVMELLGYEDGALKRGGLEDIGRRAGEMGLEKLLIRLQESHDVGMPTLEDMLGELSRPGRDPREGLPPPLLRRDVLTLEDLKPGMELTGTVRNVTDFGAFVDLGVHLSGLVHISRMAKHFIRHPSQVVSVGDVVKVWVLEADKARQRISLTMVAP